MNIENETKKKIDFKKKQKQNKKSKFRANDKDCTNLYKVNKVKWRKKKHRAYKKPDWHKTNLIIFKVTVIHNESKAVKLYLYKFLVDKNHKSPNQQKVIACQFASSGQHFVFFFF